MADDAVEDLGVQANERQRGRSILRLSAALLRSALAGDELTRRKISALGGFVVQSSDLSDSEVRARIEGLPSELDPTWFGGMPHNPRRIDVIRANVDSPDGVVMALAYYLRHAPQRDERSATEGTAHELEGTGQDDADFEGAGRAVTEDDQSVYGSQRAIELSEHSKGVRQFAQVFADSVGVGREIADDIALAAFLHDAGKAHPDFKLWLYGGDAFHLGSPPLAKSGRRLSPRARKLANLPKGARHEAASLLLALQHPEFRQAHDPDLVMWLVGTHHGYGRPFFTDAAWPPEGETFSADLGDGEVQSRAAPAFADLQSEWLDLRGRVQDTYGPWGLARLEAILRLADHRRSEWEQLPESNEESE